MNPETVRRTAEADFWSVRRSRREDSRCGWQRRPRRSAAQRLRYRTLYVERGGRPDDTKVIAEMDADEWDGCAPRHRLPRSA